MSKSTPKRKVKFQPSEPNSCVIYTRMSSEMQNSRSPQQQEDEIRSLIQRHNLPWEILKSYRDSGLSGRTHERPELKRMLSDLRTGAVSANIILVDTFERFSRSDTANELRQKLRSQGILVLTADTQFADPTIGIGRLQAAFESIRAEDQNRVKAHDVRRGKRDSVRLGRWPGGRPPLGFKLVIGSQEIRQQHTVYHNKPVEDERTAWIIREIFRLADERGWGGNRIAEFLNRDERVRSAGIILLDTTVASILRNPLYIGRMVFGKSSRESNGDNLYLESTHPDDWIINDSFCEGIVSREVWDRVHTQMDRRKRPESSGKDDGKGHMVGRGQGVALKYPLSGLVVCGTCGRAMVAGSSAAYQTASGDMHEYVYYGCPAKHAHNCENRTTISEPALRQAVMQLVVKRLFLGEALDPSKNDTSALTLRIAQNSDFGKFVQLVVSKLNERQPDAEAAREGMVKRRAELDTQCQGWLLSLGDPKISHSLRGSVQEAFNNASLEMRRIDTILTSEQAELQHLQTLASPNNVAKRLAELGSIIGNNHASLVNVTLAEHIDVIRCHPDRTVCVRFCRLGALTDPAGLTSIPALCDPNSPSQPSLPRRRTRRNVSDTTSDHDTDQSTIIDPRRFSGLQEQWFEEEHFVIPERLYWYQEHGRAVAEYRLSTHATMDEMAKHFGCSTPTIRAALRFAEKTHGIQARGRKISHSTWKTWARLHALEVAAFLERSGATKAGAEAHFGKSLQTINSALKIASELSSGETQTSPAE